MFLWRRRGAVCLQPSYYIGRSTRQLRPTDLNVSRWLWASGGRQEASSCRVLGHQRHQGRLIQTFGCRLSPSDYVSAATGGHQLMTSRSVVSAAASSHGHDKLSATTVTRTTLDPNKRRLDVTWNDGEQTSYPYVWLRDCCQCSACFHPVVHTRRLNFVNTDLNMMPENVETNSLSQEVIITWPDEHRSVFHYSWLLSHSFRYAEQQARARWNGRPPKLWDSSIVQHVPHVDLNQFLTKDTSLYEWLTSLEEMGFAVLTSVPQEHGQLHRIAARIAYLRKTILGETSFEHTVQETSTDAGYTVASQELHNDLIHYYNVPGMKMVHCISQPANNEAQVTQFVDGFQAAMQLKNRYPDHFRLLSTVKLDFFGSGHNSILISRHPTIKLDEAGEVIQIHYSTRSRDTFMHLSIDEVEPMYHALKQFASLLFDPNNVVEMQLKTGVVYCFNNWRILHGRKAFRQIPGSEPVFERGYIDWDELHSRRRILKSKLGISDEDF
jgi:gamma-butyrobetaine dioxygenase